MADDLSTLEAVIQDACLRTAKALHAEWQVKWDAATARIAELEAEQGRNTDARDNAEQWADWLAYAIDPSEEIGEHTRANNPWENALIVASRLHAWTAELRKESDDRLSLGLRWRDRAELAEAQVARVRALHRESGVVSGMCRDCAEQVPCSTIRALDGPEPTSNSAVRLEPQVEATSAVASTTASSSPQADRCGWICDLPPGHDGDHAASLGDGLALFAWPRSANLIDRAPES